MDPDQTAESQAAQACMPPVASSETPAAPAPIAPDAPGPVQDAGQTANPMLAPVAPADGGEPAAPADAGGPTEEGLENGKKLLEGAGAGGSLLHAGIDLSEGAKATKETVEAAEAVKASFSGPTLAAMGLAPTEAIAAAAEGAPSFAQTVSQAQATAGAGGITANLLAPVSLAMGGIETAEAVGDISDKGANLENVPKLIQGAAETTAGGIGTLGLAGSAATALGAGGAGAGMTAAAAAAAPVAMVAGAGAGGMAIGGLMAKAADSQYAKGWGDDGNKTAMDVGAGWGTWVDEHTGDCKASSPSVLGGIAAGAGGIAMGTVGAAQAGYNWLKSTL